MSLHSSLLYEAATNSLASEASSENTWVKMVSAALAEPTVAKFQRELRDVERLIKEEYKLSSMPNAWRSAKSVVITALKVGIMLLDSNSQPKGKTEIQTALKLAKGKSAKTCYDHCCAGFILIHDNFTGCDPAEQSRILELIKTEFDLK